tara:strand:+ start:251 stop:577 length:327 start_codon:yes stop_codon:yes gene_type:complete
MKKLIATLSVVLFANQASAESTILSSKSAHSLCTSGVMHWVDFCNGLIQGYADYASLSGAACIPTGTTRTTMITVYINFLPQSDAYKQGESALQAAVEILGKAYPCSY